MDFTAAANFVTEHPRALLAGAWALVMAGVGIRQAVTHFRPARPIKHGPEYLASKAKAAESLARLGANGPNEP